MRPYAPAEQRELLDAVARGAASPPCPRCGRTCAVIRARPRDDVAYVRDRLVVRCLRCGRSCQDDAVRQRGV